MSNTYSNFYYDPVRQGYDTTTWTTLLGVPAVVASQLSLHAAGIIHFADLLRGEAAFNVSFHAPTAGDNTKFGFIQLNKDAHLLFKIAENVLTAESSNGTTTNSVVIAWDSTWTNANTEFKIKWEAGRATFSIGGQYKTVIEDASIPGDPLSIYAYSNNATSLLINDIIVKGIESSTLKIF
jgi:hypothetical protein